MLSIEELSEEVEKISKVAQDTHKQVTTMMEIKNKDHPLHEGKANNDDDNHEGQNDDDKNHEGKSGNDDDDKNHTAQDEEHKKEARAARYKAMKLAMEMDDEEKRDAAIKSAMEQTDPTHNTTTNEKEGQTEEEKEEHAAVASIIGDKRAEYIEKILSANRLFNASNIDSVEKRVRKASLTSLKKEYKTILPFIGGAKAAQSPAAEPPVIPYFASMMTPQEIDAKSLTASSPDSAFAKLTTKELLEMAN
jgi:hypothetical protein